MPPPLVGFNAVTKLQPIEVFQGVVILHFRPRGATETRRRRTRWLQLHAGTRIHRLLSDINYAPTIPLELQLDLGLFLFSFHLTQE